MHSAWLWTLHAPRAAAALVKMAARRNTMAKYYVQAVRVNFAGRVRVTLATGCVPWVDFAGRATGSIVPCLLAVRGWCDRCDSCDPLRGSFVSRGT